MFAAVIRTNRLQSIFGSISNAMMTCPKATTTSSVVTYASLRWTTSRAIVRALLWWSMASRSWGTCSATLKALRMPPGASKHSG